MHHHPLRLLAPSPSENFRFRIVERTKPIKISVVVLLTLSLTATSVRAQVDRKSLSYSSGYSVQTLRIEGDFVRYQYEEDNGKLQRAGQVRISDLDLVNAAVDGGPDLFGVELRCKNGLECLDYTWIDARVERGKPPVKGTNAVRSFPLNCKEKQLCSDFLAALKNNKGSSDKASDGRRQPTVDGPDIPKDGIYPRYSPTLSAPSPQAKPLPPAPTIEEANFSKALSTLGSLISFDKSAGASVANDSSLFDPASTDVLTATQKREVRGWLQNLSRNLEDQTGNLAALYPHVEDLPTEFLVDRDLWVLGFGRIVHPMNSQRHQTFPDRFFDLFDLWDNN